MSLEGLLFVVILQKRRLDGFGVVDEGLGVSQGDVQLLESLLEACITCMTSYSSKYLFEVKVFHIIFQFKSG